MFRKLALSKMVRAVAAVAVLAVLWLVAAAPIYQGPSIHW
jgi:hypothetical protein